MTTATKWHDSAEKRKAIGDSAEREFEKEVRCVCGGRFAFIGDSYPGCPDFTCEQCGALVDVKSSPQSKQTGNLAVSSIPWRNYPGDLLLVTNVSGKWIGEYKRNIILVGREQSPTHSPDGSQLGATRFYLISWKTFRTLSDLGFTVEKVKQS